MRAWQMTPRRFQVDWQVMLLLAPIGLELIRLLLGRSVPSRLFYLGPGSPWMVGRRFVVDLRLCCSPP